MKVYIRSSRNSSSAQAIIDQVVKDHPVPEDQQFYYIEIDAPLKSAMQEYLDGWYRVVDEENVCKSFSLDQSYSSYGSDGSDIDIAMRKHAKMNKQFATIVDVVNRTIL